MKKLLLALSFVTIAATSALGGTVNLTFVTDSLQNSCQLPQNILFLMAGTSTGYTSGTDSIDLYIAFGDGTDTTFKANASSNFFGHTEHTYTMPGIYTVMYVATGPDGAADTVVVPNEIVLGNTCDNISGRVYIDHDNDCTFSTGDEALPWRQVKLKLGGQVILQTITDQNGDYSFTAVVGNTYDVELGSTSLPVGCPSAGSYTVSSFPAANLDFGIDCSGSQVDLEASYYGGFAVPGVTTGLYFSIHNNQCTPTDGVAKLVLNSDVTYQPSSSSYISQPDSIVGDTLFFSFTQLGITNYFSVRINIKGDTNLTVNDSVCVSLIAESVIADSNPANNTANPCIEVRTSYDPNMKTVYPAGEGSAGNILPDQSMMYTIHFQNTGNFMASNIYILDTIDTQTLDLNTLEILDFSHPMEMIIIDGNILRFNFNSIMLPDSNSNEPESHGYVSFRIDQKGSLPDGTKIENTAGIYFDYNPPVITNTTLNTINRSIGIDEYSKMDQPDLFRAFPNPASESINIVLVNETGKAGLKMYDMTGKRVLGQSVSGTARISISKLPSGVYILKVTEGQLAQQKKVVIQ